jgi:hypothetical protein
LGYTGIYIDRKGIYRVICGITQYMRIGKIKKIAGFEPRTSCILHGCSTTAPPASIPERLFDGISKIDAKLGKHITCRLVSDVRCGPRRPTRAGHDVACPGCLDLDGPDASVRSVALL